MQLNVHERRALDWRVIGLGVALMLLGPGLLWSLWTRYRYHPPDVAIPEWAFGLVWYGLAAFALGWLLVGAGSRPGDSAARGAALAAAAYLLVGLTWAVAFDLGVNEATLGELLVPRRLTAILLHALIWPLILAGTIGLFGLEMG